MIFVDNLAYSLFIIGFAGLIILYTISSIYKVSKHGKKNFLEYLEGASVPLFILGSYIFITGILGQILWPLPGSYNILFFDPYISFGIVLLAFSVSAKYKIRLGYIGFFGLLVGIMVMVYGIHAYSLGMTKAPLMLLLMYVFYGLAGIMSCPIAFFVDKLTRLQRHIGFGWDISFILFWIFLFIASILAITLGATALPYHLASPP